MFYLVSTRYMTGPNRNVTGTEQTHKVLDIVTTGISPRSSYDIHVIAIYLFYIRYMSEIYQVLSNHDDKYVLSYDIYHLICHMTGIYLVYVSGRL